MEGGSKRDSCGYRIKPRAEGSPSYFLEAAADAERPYRAEDLAGAEEPGLVGIVILERVGDVTPAERELVGAGKFVAGAQADE